MRARLLTGMFLAFLFATWCAAQQQTAKDLDRLQGSWKLVGYEALGKKSGAAEVAEIGVTLHIEGDRYAEQSAGEVAEKGTIKLFPAKNPKQIDIMIGSGRDEGKTQLGLYKVEGDTLIFAIAPAGSTKRPTTFATQIDSNFNVQTFQRTKK